MNDVESEEPSKCTRCGTAIPNYRNAKAKYCSKNCSTLANPPPRSPGSIAGLNTGMVGAIGELIVSVDLLSKGYETFRALSQSCSCDLAILMNGVLKRVEVRTGHRMKSGKLSYPKYNKADIMAVVVDGVEIVYIPELTTTDNISNAQSE